MMLKAAREQVYFIFLSPAVEGKAPHAEGTLRILYSNSCDTLRLQWLQCLWPSLKLRPWGRAHIGEIGLVSKQWEKILGAARPEGGPGKTEGYLTLSGVLT